MIHGVGINDAGYPVRIKKTINGKVRQVWSCKYYEKWKGMITRAYSKSRHNRNPSYIGCSVCDEWLTFSNFRSWMIEQEVLLGSLDSLQLDKDILFEDNKVYSPETCVFVCGSINSFFAGTSKTGKYKKGVKLNKKGVFYSQVSNLITGKVENLGYFKTEDEAHNAWRKRKHELSCQLADSDLVQDERVAEALRNRYAE